MKPFFIWLGLVGLGLSAHPGRLRSATLHGNTTLGYYYLRAQVGSPTQEKLLILDTGSQLTVFPCRGCLNCGGHTTPAFDYESSSSFQFMNPKHPTSNWTCPVGSGNRCHFQQRYLEGSEYMGYFGEDVFALGKEDVAKGDRHIIGCALSETNDFVSQQVDGILALGSGGPGQTPPTFVDILYSADRIATPNFSILLGTNKGRITLGGWNSDFHEENSLPSFVDCSKTDWNFQYEIELLSLHVN